MSANTVMVILTWRFLTERVTVNERQEIVDRLYLYQKLRRRYRGLSIFDLCVGHAAARNGFLYDTAFGVEGSMGAVLIIVVVIIAVLLLNRGKGEKNDLWKVS